MVRLLFFVLCSLPVYGQPSGTGRPRLDSLSPVEKRIDKNTVLHHFFLNNELVALELVETGDLANSTYTTWYFDGDVVESVIRKECRTDDTQILDLAMYAESHRRSDGTIDYSDLPTNCMILTVDFQEPRMLRTIQGKDIFPAAPEYNTERKLLYDAYFDLVKEVSMKD